MVPLSLIMLCPPWDLSFLRSKIVSISHISHLINPSFSFWNSDEKVVLKYRFYFYSARVRPTAQEMIVIERRVCYSFQEEGAPHTIACSRLQEPVLWFLWEEMGKAG